MLAHIQSLGFDSRVRYHTAGQDKGEAGVWRRVQRHDHSVSPTLSLLATSLCRHTQAHT